MKSQDISSHKKEIPFTREMLVDVIKDFSERPELNHHVEYYVNALFQLYFHKKVVFHIESNIAP